MMKNPVMFVVEVVAALTTVIFIRDWMSGGEHLGFTFQIIVWLWFTVLFANFAEAVAEGRGKAQAATSASDPRRDQGQAHRRCEDGARSCRPRQASLRPDRSCWSKPAT